MKNEYLRHTLATIDYRFQKSVKYRNTDFGDYAFAYESPHGLSNCDLFTNFRA